MGGAFKNASTYHISSKAVKRREWGEGTLGHISVQRSPNISDDLASSEILTNTLMQ